MELTLFSLNEQFIFHESLEYQPHMKGVFLRTLGEHKET